MMKDISGMVTDYAKSAVNGIGSVAKGLYQNGGLALTGLGMATAASLAPSQASASDLSAKLQSYGKDVRVCVSFFHNNASSPRWTNWGGSSRNKRGYHRACASYDAAVRNGARFTDRQLSEMISEVQYPANGLAKRPIRRRTRGGSNYWHQHWTEVSPHAAQQTLRAARPGKTDRYQLSAGKGSAARKTIGNITSPSTGFVKAFGQLIAKPGTNLK